MDVSIGLAGCVIAVLDAYDTLGLLIFVGSVMVDELVLADEFDDIDEFNWFNEFNGLDDWCAFR